MLEANPSTKIVFLTVEKDKDTCRAVLELGACGFVLKPRLATDLIPAIGLAKEGHRFVSSGSETLPAGAYKLLIPCEGFRPARVPISADFRAMTTAD
jgi:DNA-binding NarL/FixJ family response regulator